MTADLIALREHDPDRFLLSFFINAKKRPDIATVDIFNCQLADASHNVSTPHMGLIKLQWWRDEIRKIYDGKTTVGNPLLDDLSNLISHYHLPIELFNVLLEAREFDVMNEAAKDLNALQDYIRNAQFPLMRIKEEIIKPGFFNQTAQDVTMAYCLIGLVRSAPYHNENQRHVLPDIPCLDIVKAAQKILPKNCKGCHRYVRAMSKLTRLYIKALLKVDGDPYRVEPVKFKELRVWWSAR